jgi:hypothetical protein
MRVAGHAARTMQYLQHFGRNISTAFTSHLKCQIIKLSFEHSTNNPVHCGRKRFLSLPRCPHRLWSPSIFLFDEYLSPFLGAKWPGHEANHSPPYFAEVRNEWRYTATFPLRLHSLDSVNFTFNTKTTVHLGRTLPFGFVLTIKSYDVLQFRSNFEKILRIADFGFIHLDNLTYDNVRVSSETKV